MNSIVNKRIRRFQKQRFPDHVTINTRRLKKLYNLSSPKRKKLYDKEMEDYNKAITQGLLKPGEPLLSAIANALIKSNKKVD